ncbi:HNH endonuclease [Nocardia panacis]
MPKAPRRCPSPGCPNTIRHARYCPDHTPAWDVPSGWRRPAGWAQDRESVLARDDWTCYLCGKPGADAVDHVMPQAGGGPDRLSNYAAVHDRNPPHCHRAKTNRDRHAQHRTAS